MMLPGLPTLQAVQAARAVRPQEKGRTRRQAKAQQDRAEATVKKNVRTACVERDGHCRICHNTAFTLWGIRDHDSAPNVEFYFTDAWPSEWAHMHIKRRSKTRGMVPEIRHTSQDSLMLCRQHHDQYDGRQQPRLLITCLTRKGADGALKFRRAQQARRAS